MSRSQQFWWTYWTVTAVMFAVAIGMLFTYTPVERTMGPIQKIFYLHLPSAINASLACLVAFVGGVGYLAQQKMRWDDLSSAGAKVAALMCTIVLITGMIWARKAWGAWWVWSPKLILSLVLWLLYVVYLVIRSSIPSVSHRSTVSAVYAIAAFLNVPLVFLSTRLIKDQHPSGFSLPELSMKLTLGVWFVPVTLLTVGLIAAAAASSGRRRMRTDRSKTDSPWSIPAPQQQGPDDTGSSSVRCGQASDEG